MTPKMQSNAPTRCEIRMAAAITVYFTTALFVILAQHINPIAEKKIKTKYTPQMRAEYGRREIIIVIFLKAVFPLCQ